MYVALVLKNIYIKESRFACGKASPSEVRASKFWVYINYIYCILFIYILYIKLSTFSYSGVYFLKLNKKSKQAKRPLRPWLSDWNTHNRNVESCRATLHALYRESHATTMACENHYNPKQRPKNIRVNLIMLRK